MSKLTAEDRQIVLNHLAHEALDVLTVALKHDDPRVRIAAAGTILNVAGISTDEPDDLSLTTLREMLFSLDPEARAAAFEGLRRRGIVAERSLSGA